MVDKKGFPDQVSWGDTGLYDGLYNAIGLYSFCTIGLPGGLMYGDWEGEIIGDI